MIKSITILFYLYKLDKELTEPLFIGFIFVSFLYFNVHLFVLRDHHTLCKFANSFLFLILTACYDFAIFFVMSIYLTYIT